MASTSAEACSNTPMFIEQVAPIIPQDACNCLTRSESCIDQSAIRDSLTQSEKQVTCCAEGEETNLPGSEEVQDHKSHSRGMHEAGAGGDEVCESKIVWVSHRGKLVSC